VRKSVTGKEYFVKRGFKGEESTEVQKAAKET